MKIMIQAFTGAYQAKSPRTPDEILTGICSAMDILPVQAVIIGWHADVSLYRSVIKEVHRRGREIFLWLPVLSEMSAFTGTFPAVDFCGASHAQMMRGDEDFSFLCPSHRQNIELVKKIYESRFGKLGFDGVFLDKLRYSSFGNGFQSAMGCFCDECLRAYEKNGLDIGSVLTLLGGKEKKFLIPATLEGMRYTFDDPLINHFFKVRAELITDAVFDLIDWFKLHNLTVGLDVFAPLFAFYVGQDIGALARKADFIKPMLYRITDAPAGLPYEGRRMREELRAYDCGTDGQIERLWGVDDLCGDHSLQVQIERLKRTPCPLYIGMEVNHKPGMCPADKAYVVNTAGIIKQSGLGCVLSWDVLSDTKNHLRAIAHLYNH